MTPEQGANKYLTITLGYTFVRFDIDTNGVYYVDENGDEELLDIFTYAQDRETVIDRLGIIIIPCGEQFIGICKNKILLSLQHGTSTISYKGKETAYSKEKPWTIAYVAGYVEE